MVVTPDPEGGYAMKRGPIPRNDFRAYSAALVDCIDQCLADTNVYTIEAWPELSVLVNDLRTALSTAVDRAVMVRNECVRIQGLFAPGELVSWDANGRAYVGRYMSMYSDRVAVVRVGVHKPCNIYVSVNDLHAVRGDGVRRGLTSGQRDLLCLIEAGSVVSRDGLLFFVFDGSEFSGGSWRALSPKQLEDFNFLGSVGLVLPPCEDGFVVAVCGV